MRLRSIHAEGIQPIQKLEVENLSDVVVLAGPNGVGKSRLLDALVNHFRSLQGSESFWIEVESTSQEEISVWGKSVLNTLIPSDSEVLRTYLQKNKKRSDQKGSLLFFESDRAIVNIQPYQFTWDTEDPFAEMISWDFGFNNLKNRFQDTINSIFRKIRSRREKIAKEFEKKSITTEGSLVTVDMTQFPDPIVTFRDAFYQLLSPKKLVDPEAEKQQLHFDDGGNQYPINQLSSGEKEVVNIVFDFILRNPSDSIIIFDEPELHLHPELSYKLIQTLKSIGSRNQFLLCTHSPDIITSSLDNSVIFIRPADGAGSNQAVIVSEDDDTHQALRLIGQSIGIVSLGRKIVLIEGNHASLDKQTYGSILKTRYPGLVMVPSEGKSTIQSFTAVHEKVLSKSVWGVEFYMLCDRDAVPAHKDVAALEAAGQGKLRVLPRYHLENYFLNARVISSLFSGLYGSDSKFSDVGLIDDMLLQSAQQHLNYSVALIVSSALRERAGNVNLMPNDLQGMSTDSLITAIQQKAISELDRVGSSLSISEIDSMVKETMSKLVHSLDNRTDHWKMAMPGRSVLRTFCPRHGGLGFGLFKTAYLKAAEGHEANPFGEIIEIFDSFA